jgi:hypothetical protein
MQRLYTFIKAGMARWNTSCINLHRRHDVFNGVEISFAAVKFSNSCQAMPYAGTIKLSSHYSCTVLIASLVAMPICASGAIRGRIDKVVGACTQVKQSKHY